MSLSGAEKFFPEWSRGDGAPNGRPTIIRLAVDRATGPDYTGRMLYTVNPDGSINVEKISVTGPVASR